MKKKKVKLLSKIMITLCLILAVFVGGYFFLDKTIIPKYFGQYGIGGVSDLVGVVTSLYKSPNESKMITNGYTPTDTSNAISKLRTANYKIEEDGTILEENFNSFQGNANVELTDREFAAVCDKMLKNGILVDVLPELNYLNVINISLLELIITPDEDSFDGSGFTSANIEFILKINTESIREQIASQMDTPLFLLNMIIPDNLYFTVTYDLDLTKQEESRANGTIAINGRTAKQSKVLIELLIDFIFPESDEMNYEKFIQSVGDIALEGIDVLGDFKFIQKESSSGKLENGILITPAV